jgi:hypothetical protein
MTHCASNRLYNDEIHDFEEAMRAYAAEAIAEMDLGEMLRKMVADAALALEIYAKHKPQIVADLRAGGLTEIANAFESNDYTGLAI